MSTVLPVPEISALDVVFGVNALSWMPKWEDIPEQYRDMNSRTEENRIVRRWFFSGLPAGTQFVPKNGIDKDAALRVVKGTLGSFEPKHEHKEAAVAYMLASWFKVKNWDKK